MLGIKAWIRTKIINNAPLVTAVGSADRILSEYPNQIAVYPIVVFLDADQSTPNQGYWDDMPNSYRSELEFHVFTQNSSTTQITTLLDNLMISLYYNVDSNREVPEPQDKIYHRVCRYSRMLRQIDLQ